MKFCLKYFRKLTQSAKFAYYVFVPDQEKDFADQFVSMIEAANELGVTGTRIRKAVADGVLPHILLFGRKLIRREDLELYRARTQPEGLPKRGRPRKTKPPPL